MVTSILNYPTPRNLLFQLADSNVKDNEKKSQRGIFLDIILQNRYRVREDLKETNSNLNRYLYWLRVNKRGDLATKLETLCERAKGEINDFGPILTFLLHCCEENVDEIEKNFQNESPPLIPIKNPTEKSYNSKEDFVNEDGLAAYTTFTSENLKLLQKIPEIRRKEMSCGVQNNDFKYQLESNLFSDFQSFDDPTSKLLPLKIALMSKPSKEINFFKSIPPPPKVQLIKKECVSLKHSSIELDKSLLSPVKDSLYKSQHPFLSENPSISDMIVFRNSHQNRIISEDRLIFFIQSMFLGIENHLYSYNKSQLKFELHKPYIRLKTVGATALKNLLEYVISIASAFNLLEKVVTDHKNKYDNKVQRAFYTSIENCVEFYRSEFFSQLAKEHQQNNDNNSNTRKKKCVLSTLLKFRIFSSKLSFLFDVAGVCPVTGNGETKENHRLLAYVYESILKVPLENCQIGMYILNFIWKSYYEELEHFIMEAKALTLVKDDISFSGLKKVLSSLLKLPNFMESVHQTIIHSAICVYVIKSNQSKDMIDRSLNPLPNQCTMKAKFIEKERNFTQMKKECESIQKPHDFRLSILKLIKERHLLLDEVSRKVLKQLNLESHFNRIKKFLLFQESTFTTTIENVIFPQILQYTFAPVALMNNILEDFDGENLKYIKPTISKPEKTIQDFPCLRDIFLDYYLPTELAFFVEELETFSAASRFVFSLKYTIWRIIESRKRLTGLPAILLFKVQTVLKEVEQEINLTTSSAWHTFQREFRFAIKEQEHNKVDFVDNLLHIFSRFRDQIKKVCLQKTEQKLNLMYIHFKKIGKILDSITLDGNHVLKEMTCLCNDLIKNCVMDTSQ